METLVRTSDGKLFYDEESAKRHELVAQYYPHVMKWASEQYAGKKGMPTRAANVIMAWEAVRSEALAAKVSSEPVDTDELDVD
jgi:hypothetical protein